MIEFKITDEEVFNKRPLLPLDIKDKWLTALKSGDYPKGKGRLNNNNKEFCCLGVWCEIEQLRKELLSSGACSYDYSSTTYLSKNSKLYNILGGEGSFKGFIINGKNNLAALNDDTETFSEVIETIEKYF